MVCIEDCYITLRSQGGFSDNLLHTTEENKSFLINYTNHRFI